jgi:hypothetical protein
MRKTMKKPVRTAEILTGDLLNKEDDYLLSHF